MKKEPNKIKLTDNPKSKDVAKIPLPPLYSQTSDSGIYNINIKPDNDSIYTPIKDENNPENDSQSI